MRYVLAVVAVLNLVSFSAHAAWWTDALSTVQSALGGTQKASAEEQNMAARALKELLSTRSQQVVAQLSRTGGFSADSKVRIPLPKEFQIADGYLSKLGMNGLTSGLQARMNRAAEQAMPEAKQLFMAAVQQMTVADAVAIVKGKDDAATQYFRQKMEPALALKMTPVVNAALAEAGALKAYENVMDYIQKNTNVALVNEYLPKVTTDFTAYTVKKALDGVFYYMAVEEKKIRDNPAQAGSALLKKVFSQ